MFPTKTCHYLQVRPMVDLVVSTTESMPLEQKLKILLLLLSPHTVGLAPVAYRSPYTVYPKRPRMGSDVKAFALSLPHLPHFLSILHLILCPQTSWPLHWNNLCLYVLCKPADLQRT